MSVRIIDVGVIFALNSVRLMRGFLKIYMAAMLAGHSETSLLMTSLSFLS